MKPSAELRERVLGAARLQPAPTRGQVRTRNAVLIASAIAVPLIVFQQMGGLRHYERPPELIVQTAMSALAIAIGAGVVGLLRGKSSVGRPSVLLVSLVVLTPLVLLAGKAGLSSLYPDMMRPWPDRPGFRCLGWSAAMAAWPLIAMVTIRRGNAPAHPYLSGAAIGAAVGAGVWVLVDLWCPVAYLPHLMVGHVLPLVLTILVGTSAGGFALAVRSPAGK
jgi:hypothetical protein